MKKMKFKDTRYPIGLFSDQGCYEHDSRKEKLLTFGKIPKQTIMGQMLGQDRLRKNSCGCSVRSDEIPSPRQTSMDESLNGVPSIGAPIHPRVTELTGDI